MLLVDFVLAPLGTPMPRDFVTSEGLRVVLSHASFIGKYGMRSGLAVNERVTLLPPYPVDELMIQMAAGAFPPIVRLIGLDGALLGVFQTAKDPNQLVNFTPPSVGRIALIEIDFPSGEGGLLTLAGCGSPGATIKTIPLSLAQALSIDVSVCQAIVYAETGTVETTADGLAGLAEARQFIAAVAYDRNGEGVAKPKYPTPDEINQPFIKRAWDRCGIAAQDAKEQNVGNCRHFVIWYSDDGGKTPSRKPSSIKDEWPYTQTGKITGHWGPYKVNVLGGSNIYVIKYCGVP